MASGHGLGGGLGGGHGNGLGLGLGKGIDILPPMWREVLADPKVRRAYVVTKVVVFVLAAAITVPLSHLIGPRAWVGLAVFGVLLVALSAGVLGMGRGRTEPPPLERPESETEDPDPDPEVVEIPLEDFIDLHPFPPRDIPDVVEAYLEQALEAGIAEVRLIHGRGTGVQRQRVRSVLDKHQKVTGFADATPDRGGWGATVAWLDVETGSTPEP